MMEIRLSTIGSGTSYCTEYKVRGRPSRPPCWPKSARLLSLYFRDQAVLTVEPQAEKGPSHTALTPHTLSVSFSLSLFPDHPMMPRPKYIDVDSSAGKRKGPGGRLPRGFTSPRPGGILSAGGTPPPSRASLQQKCQWKRCKVE